MIIARLNASTENDWQLAAHGPEGDGAISAVGAEAQGIEFEEEPEIPDPGRSDDEDQ